MENYVNLRKDSVIFYKVNLLLDVDFDDEYYCSSSKLNSFFGQIGVYENSEKLLNLVENLYKDLYFSFLVFNEISDFRESELLSDNQDIDTIMFFNFNNNYYKEDNFIDEIYNVESFLLESEHFEYDDLENFSENKIILEESIGIKNEEIDGGSQVNDSNDGENNSVYLEESKSKDIEEEDGSEDEENEEDDEDYFSFFIPLIMIFYRGDRRMDYFLGNEFKEKLFFKKKILPFKEKLYIKKFLKKNFFFKKMYVNNYFLKKFNKNKKNFFSLIKNNNIAFIVKDFMKYYIFDAKKKIKLRKKKKFRMFKKLKLKLKSKKYFLIKDNKWWNINYILFLLNIKFFFLSNYYSHKNYLVGIFNFFSQAINMKKKFFRRYRRKRRFKKDFFINFFGKRAKLNVIINDFEEEANKKGKGKSKRR